MSVSCECCVLSGRGLCVWPITHPEESYRVWCLSECDGEASIMSRPWTTGGCCTMGKKLVTIHDDIFILVKDIPLCLNYNIKMK